MIRIGTCSWTEKTLIQSGEFYPGDVKTAEGRLRYYASQFDTVEVDSTYYALPEWGNRWSPPVPCHDNQYVYACASCTVAPARSFRNL